MLEEAEEEVLNIASKVPSTANAAAQAGSAVVDFTGEEDTTADRDLQTTSRRTLRAKRRREERTETAMGEPASNLPSSGGNKKARSSSFGTSINCVGGPSRVGRVVRIAHSAYGSLAMEAKRRERRAKKNGIRE